MQLTQSRLCQRPRRREKSTIIGLQAVVILIKDYDLIDSRCKPSLSAEYTFFTHNLGILPVYRHYKKSLRAAGAQRVRLELGKVPRGHHDAQRL